MAWIYYKMIITVSGNEQWKGLEMTVVATHLDSVVNYLYINCENVNEIKQLWYVTNNYN